jgi:hypothetical protein
MSRFIAATLSRSLPAHAVASAIAVESNAASSATNSTIPAVSASSPP